jgi:hypothetical protein
MPHGEGPRVKKRPNVQYRRVGVRREFNEHETPAPLLRLLPSAPPRRPLTPALFVVAVVFAAAAATLAPVEMIRADDEQLRAAQGGARGAAGGRAEELRAARREVERERKL